jgi:hypothetical protein
MMAIALFRHPERSEGPRNIRVALDYFGFELTVAFSILTSSTGLSPAPVLTEPIFITTSKLA